MEAVDVMKVVSRLCALSKDTENQPVIARRGVLPPLVNFLVHHNIEVVRSAAEAIRNLASNAECQELMCREANLVDRVTTLFNNTTDAQVREFVTQTLMYLSDYFTDEQKKASLNISQVLAMAKSQQQQQSVLSTPVKQSTAKRGSPIVKRSVQLVLSLPNMTSQRKLEDALLDIRGTISYTIDVSEKKVNLFTRCSADRVVQALEERGYVGATLLAELEESATAADGIAKPLTNDYNAPKYFSPEKKKQTTAAESEYQRSLTTVGADTLEARIARKNQQKLKKEQEQQGMKRFITKIASVFW